MNHSAQFILAPRAYGSFLYAVWQAGVAAAPNGEPTHEVIGGDVVVHNPLDRVITSKARRMNVAFGFMEWLSMMTGNDDIRYYTAFIKNYDRFSTDGKTLDGAYGPRLVYRSDDENFNTMFINQLEEVERILTVDPWSRRAVASIYNHDDLTGGGGLNTPCTLNLQFLIRDDALHMIVYMRSSDIFKGLTYDVFAFTLIQEYLARRLGVALGTYLHRAGSLHLYDYDIPRIAPIIADPRWPTIMNSMPPLERIDIALASGLLDAGLFHHRVFVNYCDKYVGRFSNAPAHQYMVGVVGAMVAFANREAHPGVALAAWRLVNDRTIRYVLRPWLVTAGLLAERTTTKAGT